MNSTNAEPNRSEAQQLLEQAHALGATTTAGASWPQLAMLLGLGGISSMFVVLMGTGASKAIYLPVMFTMFVWLAILIITGMVFTRNAKVGFGRRWVSTIGAWAVLWIIAMVAGPFLFEGQLWFFLLMAALITAATTAGAWIEARR